MMMKNWMKWILKSQMAEENIDIEKQLLSEEDNDVSNSEVGEQTVFKEQNY